jgi:hypothetical protein
MLTKQNYLALNNRNSNFTQLTKAEKDKKYQNYLLRFKERNQNEKMILAAPMRKMNPKSRTRKNPQNKPAATKMKFSECLLTYARASIDPFENIQKLPCIPDSLSAPSYKFKVFIDTDMIIGTEGVGFAAFNPWAMAINNAGASTAGLDYPLVVTTATYPEDIFDATLALLTADQISGSNSNSPYPYPELDTGSIRLVAGGLEIDYSGELLNQSGVVSVIQWDGLQTVPLDITTSLIRSNQRTQVCPTSREARCYVRYEPTSSSNFDYTSIDNYLPTHGAPLAKGGIYYPLLAYVSGATPGTSFRVRAISFFELQLSNAPTTPSESDPIGFPAFQSARTTVLPTPDPRSDLFTILKQTAVNIAHTISGFAPTIGMAIGATLGNPTFGASVGNVSKELFESMLN